MAQGELTTAYNTLGGLGPGTLIGAGGLSGNNLTPGVYSVSSTAFDLAANSTLTLTGNGMFTFIMSSALVTGSGATVDVSALGAASSVFWIVRSSATLGPNTDFAGNILALTSIGFDPGATDLCGRALARNGSVTFAGVGTTVESGESTADANQVGGKCQRRGRLEARNRRSHSGERLNESRLLPNRGHGGLSLTIQGGGRRFCAQIELKSESPDKSVRCCERGLS